MTDDPLDVLLTEYERATAYTDALWRDLSTDHLLWRPHEQSSAIGWHLGHQAHVTHFMIRNLTAAEPSPDPELDDLMDSATAEPDRGHLPDPDRLSAFRETVSGRVRYRIDQIRRGDVGAPDQLHAIASTLMVAVVNHEYQHDKWICEVREHLGHHLPTPPSAPRLQTVDGYLLLSAPTSRA